MPTLNSVAKVDPLEPVSTLQSSVLQVVAAPPNPVAGPVATGYTSTEGVDLLSFVVVEEGLHLVTMAIACITNSNAATSHFVRPTISSTTPTGSGNITGVGIVGGLIGLDYAIRILDADGAAVANSYGFDAKGGSPGEGTAVSVPVLAKLESTITLKFHHTVTGACTDGGTYRIGMSIVKL